MISNCIIKTILKVESNGSGFYLDKGDWHGELKVLFEGHYFHKLTKGKYDKTRPDLSYSKWTKKYYRKGQKEFTRFMEAVALDKKAALLSTSFGLFQILGINYEDCGYDSVYEMIDSFYKGKDSEQILAFLNYCKNRQGVKLIKGKPTRTGKSLYQHLEDLEWKEFAGGYNGIGQIEYYANKLEKTYNSCQNY